MLIGSKSRFIEMFGNIRENNLSLPVRKMGDIVEIRNGRDYKAIQNDNGKYPVYGTGGIMTYADDYLCPENTVIIGRKGTIDNPLLVREKFWNVDTAFGMICNQENLNPVYYFWFCKQYDFKKHNKATTLPSLVKADLQKIDVIVPEKTKQDEFASFVEQVDKSKVVSESSSKSRFIEIFGDCKETIPIGKVCSLHSRIGWQALTKAEHMATGEYMLITGTDFKDGTIDYTGCKYVSKDRYEMDPNIIIQNGDVLVTKDGTIGKVAVVKDLPKPATLNAGVFVVRNTDNQFLTEFIQQCLLSSNFQRFIESVKRGATIVHLNQEKFLKYELPVADLNIQHQFVDFVQQVDKSKVTV